MNFDNVAEAWVLGLASKTKVKRLFPTGAPSLKELNFLRVVIRPEHLKIVLAFVNFPPTATPSWRVKGYTTVELIFRLDQPQVLGVDWKELCNVSKISVVVDPALRLLKLTNENFVLLESTYTTLNADFEPDPQMQFFDAASDNLGTSIEPAPFGIH